MGHHCTRCVSLMVVQGQGGEGRPAQGTGRSPISPLSPSPSGRGPALSQQSSCCTTCPRTPLPSPHTSIFPRDWTQEGPRLACTACLDLRSRSDLRSVTEREGGGDTAGQRRWRLSRLT